MLAVNDAGVVSLWSRRGTNLTARFPDLTGAMADMMAPGTALDGEVVIWADGRTSFELLATRTASTTRAAAAARAHPASYVAFDVLADTGTDVRAEPLDKRRKLLERHATGWSPPLTLCPQTRDLTIARGWFTELAVAGVEGLVIKGGSQHYRGGARDWVKVRHRQPLDVVCAAVLGPLHAPTAAVAGLPLDGRLRIVGATGSLPARAARELSAHLVPAGEDHPWPTVVRGSSVHGFSATGQVHLTRVEPLVIEVSADTAWSGTTFRHALRLQRVRPDLDPVQVTPPT